MEKNDYDALTPEQKERVQRFISITLIMNEKEQQAIDGEIPMTQELFDSITNKCVGESLENFFYDFIVKYPEFLKSHAERIEAELNAKPMPEGWHEPTPEEHQASWEKLCARIRETYGPDAI